MTSRGPRGMTRPAAADPIAQLHQLETQIIASRVRTLNATPVIVVPAPGTGWFIEVTRVVARLRYGGTAYDSIGGAEELQHRYTNGAGAQVATAIPPTGFANATSDQVRTVLGFNPAGTPLTPVENAPIVSYVDSSEWYAAAGNSDLLIRVLYHVLPY